MSSHSNESQKLKKRLKIFSSLFVLFVALILGIVLSANYFKPSLSKPSLPSSVAGVETPVEIPKIKATSPEFTLTLNKSGDGTIYGYGINCGIDCSGTYPQGTHLYLYADCRNGPVSWSGDCSGGNERCFLVMDSDKIVNATITPSDKLKNYCDPNGIGAYFETEQEIKNATGMRYKFRINQNLANRPEWGKIIFNGLAFYNPDSDKGWGYFLETNIYNYHAVYTDQTSCSNPPDIYPNSIAGEGGYFVSGSDYHTFPECFDTFDNDGDGDGKSKIDYPNDRGCSSLLDNDERDNPPLQIPQWESGRVGLMRMNDATRQIFPRKGIEIDSISGLTKIESISNINMNGKDVYAEILRGDKFTVTEPVEEWGYRYISDLTKLDFKNPKREDFAYRCESKLPTGEYRTWKLKAIIDGETYAWEYAFPETHSKYIHPQVKNFFTEFFNNPGFFQVYLWDIEVLKEGDTNWLPLKKWKVGSSWYGPNEKTNGFKLANYNNHPVIEVSNDGTDTYYKYDDVFEIPAPFSPPSAAISASPNPCSIPQNQTMCSSTISWNATNAPNACILLKESKQVFACGQSGNSVAPWITEQGATFEVHLTSDINSQLLASVLVKGEKQIIGQHSLNVSKSGTGQGAITGTGINCGTDCNETYNQETSVTLTATPDSNSTLKNQSGDCFETNNTCNLVMNSNKTVTAVFEIKVTPPVSVCSTGPIRACIDSITPNPAKAGESITFTGHGEKDDSGKTIAKYRWRLDSVTGKTRICKAEESVICQVDTADISTGIHTVYFRVGTSKLLGLKTEWSNWIGRQFTVNDEFVPPTCGNNICEPGETHSNCSLDCPLPPSNIPATPSNFQAWKRSRTSIKVSWIDKSSNETKFELERSDKDGLKIAEKFELPANSRMYEDTVSFTPKFYRIRACNNNGCSENVETEVFR